MKVLPFDKNTGLRVGVVSKSELSKLRCAQCTRKIDLSNFFLFVFAEWVFFCFDHRLHFAGAFCEHDNEGLHEHLCIHHVEVRS